ncbi:small nuclear ribonucleoprotein Sm D3 [Tritrichomonas musculus]|uniref:Small nuclear ribonucleoprotein Sm D3 n=1 Tax=Tritrichomonas musculus TaxID=1915356 RepID=A0ABR2K7G8_9EUKA
MSAHIEFNLPLILLHEANGFVVSVELKTGEIYRGTLEATEDYMNCELTDVTYTNLNGEESHVDRVYIRGSNILFFVIPDMFVNNPYFVDPKTVRGHSYGYAGNLRNKAYASKIRSRFY